MSKADWLALIPLGAVLLAVVLAQVVAFGTRTGRERRRLIHLLEVLEKRPVGRGDLAQDQAWTALEHSARFQLNRYQAIEGLRDFQYQMRLLFGITLSYVLLIVSGLVLPFLRPSSVLSVVIYFGGLIALGAVTVIMYNRRAKEFRQAMARISDAPAIGTEAAGESD